MHRWCKYGQYPSNALQDIVLTSSKSPIHSIIYLTMTLTFHDLTQNVMRSSLYHNASLMKVWWKSVRYCNVLGRTDSATLHWAETNKNISVHCTSAAISISTSMSHSSTIPGGQGRSPACWCKVNCIKLTHLQLFWITVINTWNDSN